MVNYDCERNTALDLLLPQTQFVVRGSIPQLAPIVNVPT